MKKKPVESVTDQAKREGCYHDLSRITAEQAQALYAEMALRFPNGLPTPKAKKTKKARHEVDQLITAVDVPSRSPVLELFDRTGWLRGDTWKAWNIFLRADQGDPLAPDEPAETMEIFTACTGRTTWPTSPARETLALIGRGGGKSLMMARKAVARSVVFERRNYPTMADGEVPTCLVLAADREQAQVVYTYILAALSSDPALAQMIAGPPTTEKIELRNGVTIVVGTSNFRWVRGRSYIFVVADEAAFWSREHRANPATAVLAAIRPGLRFVDSQLCIISTPYAQQDAVWELFKRYYGQDGDVLVWKAPTAVMNPTLPQAVIDKARAADPVAAKSEWDAEFRSDMESFLPTDVVEDSRDVGIRIRDVAHGALIVGFADPSGAGSPLADDFVVTFGHPELGPDDSLVSVIDEVVAIRPPFRPDDAVAHIAARCRFWGVDTLVGDRYAGSWPAASFSRYGITYIPCVSSKSELYLEALPLFTSGRVRLVDEPRLIAQLIALERRSGRQGKDSVDHPPVVGAHDDLANATCGCIVLCQTMAADLVTAEAQRMSPAEAHTLASFRREFGLREPYGGWNNVVEDTEIYRGESPGWDLHNGYIDGNLGDFNK